MLAAEGARGLTHRRVDREAGLPQGSTSAYFRTRDALLEAALHRHIELDMPPGKIAADPEAELSAEQLRGLIVAAVDNRLDPKGRHLLIARYELFLDSTRRPALHAELSDTHARYLKLLAGVLGAGGCASPDTHAAELLAALDGIILNQLVFTKRGLDRAEIEALVERMLATC